MTDHAVMTRDRVNQRYPGAFDAHPRISPELAEKVEMVDEPRRTKKVPVTFKPNKKQLGVAKVRIREALACRGYSVIIDDRADAIAFCMKHVSNNRGQLGNRETGDFRLVIETALDALIAEKAVELNDKLGTFKLIQKPKRRKRHSCNRPQRYGQRAA